MLPAWVYLLEFSTCIHGVRSVFRATGEAFVHDDSAEGRVLNAVLLTARAAITAGALSALPSSEGGVTPELAGALALVAS